ncbi:MAG: hypothetical protein QM831_01650 [Kofleriaceae bacterium]
MAHVPARLPRTIADLADWSVYADQLSSEADPLGEYIATELAVPATPSFEQIAAFNLLAGARCRQRSPTADASWSLGFVRELVLIGAMVPRSYGPVIESVTLDNAIQLLSSPAYSRVELVHMPVIPVDEHVQRMLNTLPASCTRVVAASYQTVPKQVAPFVDALPSHVRTLRLTSTNAAQLRIAISDRFDCIEVFMAGPPPWAEIEAALASSSNVRVHIERIDGAQLANDRIGGLTDIGFVRPNDRSVRTGKPIMLLEHQREHGFVPIRAHLEHTIPEMFWFSDYSVRRVGPRWTGKYRLRDEIVEIHDGDVIQFSDGDEVFCTHDLVARAREM